MPLAYADILAARRAIAVCGALEAELAQIERSDSAQTTFARNYTGLLT